MTRDPGLYPGQEKKLYMILLEWFVKFKYNYELEF